MQLPRSPGELAAFLPDVPRWVETRSLLLAGTGVLSVGDHGDAGIVVDTVFPSGSIVGRADRVLLRAVLASVPADFELVVQTDALGNAQVALPAWTITEVIVHALPRPYRRSLPDAPGVVVSAPPDQRILEGLPDDIRRYGELAAAIAVRLVDGAVVALCAAGDVTETLWDVGIDTLEGHRRRGHAAACFHALAARMAEQGRQPVWSAEEGYLPSIELAAKLGFVPLDRIAVLSPGAAAVR